MSHQTWLMSTWFAVDFLAKNDAKSKGKIAPYKEICCRRFCAQVKSEAEENNAD
jgi:hypothetical protein